MALVDTRDRMPSSRVPDDLLLDAARTCVLTHGVRRTTLAEIARTAGVSRMTLYRRFPDARSVLAALLTREFGALLHDVSRAAQTAPTARERLVDSALAVVRALTDDPLMRTVLDRDSELVLPYVTERIGATQRLAEEVVHTLLREGHHDGSIRQGKPAAQIRAILLIVQSFVLSLTPATADVDVQDLLGELRQMLGSALAP